jgi:hypothetical protein
LLHVRRLKNCNPEEVIIDTINSNPIKGLDRPIEIQEVEALRFKDNWYMKVLRLSALHTGRLYPQELFMVPISVRG